MESLPRVVQEDCGFHQHGDYVVPAGQLALVCPELSQRDPTIFADPDRFDPDRFAPPREEHQRPFALITWGTGGERLLGATLATMQAEVLWSTWLRGFELELLDTEPLAVPRDHRHRFDDDERLFPPAPAPRKHYPDNSVNQLQPRPGIRFVGYQCQLLAKREILQGKIGARPDGGRDQRSGGGFESAQHGAPSMSEDSAMI